MRNSIKLAFAVSIIIVVFIVALLIWKNDKISGDWVGISLHALNTTEAQLVEESGAGWIRIDCFEGFDTALANATTHGLKVLGILDSWMFNKSLNFTLEEWCDNVTYYVSQYADYVDAWEIWNEPAHPNYTLSMEKYYSMVETASPIIRQYDPTAKIVLFGGLNLFSGGDQNLELDKNFSKKLVTTNITQYGDVLSVHAYPWMKIVQPSIWKNYTDSLEYYKELYPSLEIWATETGHYTIDVTDIEEEEEQARYMRDALQYFKGRVTRLFWYSLKDNSWEEPKHFGLIGNDGKPRLAYYELQRALEEEIPFWMQWWFWIIIAVLIVTLAGAVYLKKRKPRISTVSPFPTEDYPKHQ